MISCSATRIFESLIGGIDVAVPRNQKGEHWGGAVSFVLKLSLEVDSCGDCGSLLYVIAEVWYLNVWEGGPAFDCSAEKRQPPCFSDNNGFWKMSMSCKMIHSNSTRFFTNFTVLVQRPNPSYRAGIPHLRKGAITVCCGLNCNWHSVNSIWRIVLCVFNFLDCLSQKIRRDWDWGKSRQSADRFSSLRDFMYRYSPRVNCEGVLAWRPLKEIIPRELSLCSVSRIQAESQCVLAA